MKRYVYYLFFFVCSLGAQAQSWELSPEVVNTSNSWVNRYGQTSPLTKMRSAFMQDPKNPKVPQDLYDIGYRFVVINQNHWISFVRGQKTPQTEGVGLAKAGTYFIFSPKDSSYYYPWCINKVQDLLKIPQQTRSVVKKDTVIIRDTVTVNNTPAIRAKQGATPRGSVSRQGSLDERVYAETKQVPVYEMVPKREPRWGAIIGTTALLAVAILVDKATDGKVNLFGLIKNKDEVYEPHMKTDGQVDDPLPSDHEEHKKTG